MPTRVAYVFFTIRCNQLSWWRKLATAESLEADASSVRPSSERRRGENARNVSLSTSTVANLCYQLSWLHKITLIYFPTDAAPQFLWKLTPFIHMFCLFVCLLPLFCDFIDDIVQELRTLEVCSTQMFFLSRDQRGQSRAGKIGPSCPLR